MIEIDPNSISTPVAPRRILHPTTVDDAEVLRLWRRGCDTYAIALAIGVFEFDVERHLHRVLDRRRTGGK